MPLSKLNSFVHYSEISVRLIFTIMKIKMMSFVFLYVICSKKARGFFWNGGGGLKKKGVHILYLIFSFLILYLLNHYCLLL